MQSITLGLSDKSLEASAGDKNPWNHGLFNNSPKFVKHWCCLKRSLSFAVPPWRDQMTSKSLQKSLGRRIPFRYRLGFSLTGSIAHEYASSSV